MNMLRVDADKMEVLLVDSDSALGSEHALLLDGSHILRKDQVHLLGCSPDLGFAI